MQQNKDLSWYIVQQEDDTCEIVKLEQLEKTPEQSNKLQWGGFESEQEAIAKRIGLIRAGKCKPQ